VKLEYQLGFAIGPKKTTKILDRDDHSQNFPGCILTPWPAVLHKRTTLALVISVLLLDFEISVDFYTELCFMWLLWMYEGKVNITGLIPAHFYFGLSKIIVIITYHRHHS
jgi:hypothetical protein